MKKHLIIIGLLATFITAQAQEERPDRKDHKRENRKEMLQQLSPEQMAQLQTKRMALELDLNESQQKELMALNTEQAAKRKTKVEELRKKKAEGKTLTAEERFNEINAKLDEELAVQAKMKKILNEEQYQTWKERKSKRHKEHRKHHGK